MPCYHVKSGTVTQAFGALRRTILSASGRPRIAVCVLSSAFTIGIAATPPAALAVHASFCNGLVRSSNVWVESGKYCSSDLLSNWTFVSNTYPGSGNITRMRAGLWTIHYPYELGHRFVDNGTFVSSCDYGIYSDSFGVINQY